MIVRVDKDRSEWRALLAEINKHAPRIRRAFLRVIRESKDAVEARALVDALDRWDFEAITNAIGVRDIEDKLRSALTAEMRTAMEKAGAITAQVRPRGLDVYSFSIAAPDVLRWTSNQAAARVVEINADTRRALRNAVSRMEREGLTTREAAKLIKAEIGLTDRMQTAVNNYRARLIEDGAMPVTRIDETVARYAERLLNLRATNIARTESAFAVRAGQRGSWEQAASRGLFTPERSTKVWIAVVDSATDEDCIALNNVEVPYLAPFPGGADVPLHVNCRCVIALRPNSAETGLAA